MIHTIISLFVAIRLIQFLAEEYLSYINRAYYLNEANQQIAMIAMKMGSEDMKKAVDYSSDRFKFGRFSGWLGMLIGLSLIASGVLGVVEREAIKLATSFGFEGSTIVIGICFFAIIGIATMIYSTPFGIYSTFVIEQKHGFNRQTLKSFFIDRLKGLLLGGILGGLVLSAILFIMKHAGEYWWLYAWLTLSGFSILTAYIYPTLLAPLFNKFSPLAEGELKDKIYKLAQLIGFEAGGISVMDASKRSSHGNAYFTGMFGKKKIVLFDTLLESLKTDEVVSVLAHELGHFKLHHVRRQLIRGIFMTGLTFYLLSICINLEDFYLAFGLQGVTNYGALIVFALWFGLIDFVMQPFESWLSRRYEFAADQFAKKNIGNAQNLGSALLKMREKSHMMPLSHPLFSAIYHSHPPLIERLTAMGYQNAMIE